MAARGRLIAVEGRSAAGKTTLVRAAARRFGWEPLAEAFDRLEPVPSLEFDSPHELLVLEQRLLAEEADRYREARQLCLRGRTVLADTWFFGPVTYSWGLVALGRAPASVGRTVERWARSLAERRSLGLPDLTVVLETTAEERARRSQRDPHRHPTALRARHEAVGKVEREFFEKVFATALPHRFRTMRGRARPADLVRTLGGVVNDADPRPTTRSDGLALLSRGAAYSIEGRRRNPGPNR